MTNILVVDDNVQFLEMLCSTLESKEYTVSSAPDGATALTLFNDKDFDLVICDLIMPKKDGMELVMEIKQVSPDTKIIAMSAGSNCLPGSTYLEVSKCLGADYILDKPFRNRELLEAVDELINNKGES